MAMASNRTIFRLGELFSSSKEIDVKMNQYKLNTGYVFNTLNSTKIASKKNKLSYNKNLIYDDRYFKCIVNPKPALLNDFTKKNPGIKIKLCPAHITFRTTKNKQQLQITQFVPEHDHDPSDKVSRLREYKETTSYNIQDTNCKNNVEAPDDPLDLGDEQIPSPISNVEVSSTPLEAARELPNFDILLRSMKINIKSTINKEEQNKKLSRVKQMLNDISDNKNDSGVALKVKSLSTYPSMSRELNRDQKNRVISPKERNQLS